ncbi:hypothetical protein B0H66DRAFT_626479 [Apodospora peruviana]|uniref:Tyrosinase copper-binding domain-containing protein n=1 Tax=Apodospora peruviana TaxID=516989 RepID=A0AAE0I1I8_9PEZI|nr:hypothetical protein B0H66DRAFT_626479 [Apodospora peruviana]
MGPINHIVLVFQAISALASPTNAFSQKPTTGGAMSQLTHLAQAAYAQAKQQAASPDLQKHDGNICSWKDVKVRREWGDLSKAERTEYINAVKCFQSTPPRYSQTIVPGARSRYDDFLATHINQTQTIHSTGNFLGWHRYYTWLYEQALHEECGYTGTQPYWDWALTAETGLHASPIFDGTATSMSGDGVPIPNQQPIALLGDPSQNLPPIMLPSGTGGGCIATGPFANLTVNMGPVELDAPGGIHKSANLSAPGGVFAYNPRCVKRDLTDEINRKYSSAALTLSNILDTKNIDEFQTLMQGAPANAIGIHGGGHYSLGGDPGRDVFASPGDPAFYLLHGNIDRVWWIWQMLDPQQRVYGEDAVMGTRTFMNNPPSENATLDDWVEYGEAAGPRRKLRELMSTQSGPFCYVYL